MIAYILNPIETDNIPDYQRVGQLDVISYKFMRKTIADPDNIGLAIVLSLRLVLFNELEEGAVIEFKEKYYRMIVGTNSISGSYSYDFEKIRS